MLAILFIIKTKPMESWIYVILIGAVAGWLAGQLFRGGGFGIIGNIVIGIIGGFIGYWLLGKLGVSFGGGLLGTILTSVIGAGVLLFVASLFNKK
jgi:uncharacterized membrane protein YeaQ/YmgE (transglycosylase-associated protein family)